LYDLRCVYACVCTRRVKVVIERLCATCLCRGHTGWAGAVQQVWAASEVRGPTVGSGWGATGTYHQSTAPCGIDKQRKLVCGLLGDCCVCRDCSSSPRDWCACYGVCGLLGCVAVGGGRTACDRHCAPRHNNVEVESKIGFRPYYTRSLWLSVAAVLYIHTNTHLHTHLHAQPVLSTPRDALCVTVAVLTRSRSPGRTTCTRHTWHMTDEEEEPRNCNNRVVDCGPR
jgi:hypothetical protein